MTDTWVMALIQSVLTPDLLKPEYRADTDVPGTHPHTGHCYAASEALYHALGGASKAYRPYVSRVASGGTHWFIRDHAGRILDPTAGQFDALTLDALYYHARGCGFLTRGPSKRARTILSRIGRRLSSDER